MKTTKFIALLLAILTLTATFTACGKKSEPVESLGPNPEKPPFPLAGTWKEIQRTAEEPKGYVTIDEDGRATIDTGEWWSFTLEPGAEWDEEHLTNQGYFWMRFFRFGDHYVLRGNGQSPSCYYYREEDYPDYDVVELTPENIGDYVEIYGYYHVVKDDDGKITSVAYYQYPRFKEGLGPHSFVNGELVYLVHGKDVTADPATGEVIKEETVGNPEGWESSEHVEFCGAGNYNSIRVGNSIAFENGNTAFMSFKEVIGAKDIIGKVYVPKGWVH